MERRRPGRPQEDRYARRVEIYRAVAPLLEAQGIGGLSMRAAARAACMSVGGLYHYFPTKRALALFPLDPSVMARACAEFHASHRELEASDPSGYLAAFLDNVLGNMLLARPAIRAAAALGEGTLEGIIALAMQRTSGELAASLRSVVPEADDAQLESTGRALRRTMVAAMLDPTIGMDELRRDVRAVLEGHRIAAMRVQRTRSRPVRPDPVEPAGAAGRRP
jgi:AcrR family transcriptional regulator